MVLDRRQMDRVLNRHPDKQGEEGNIYFFGTPENPLALKEWYSTHEKTVLQEQFGTDMPISPFFHKMEFYKMSLIHDLFPDHTVGVIGSVDSRIQTDAAGEITFAPNAALPMIVMERADSDPDLEASMDALVAQAYQDFATGRENFAQGTIDNPIPALRDQWDQTIREQFGTELEDTMRSSGALTSRDRSLAIEKALWYAKEHHPDSIVVKMLNYGIAPSHPAMNFIPQAARPDVPKPHGTFIELQIIDAQCLRDKLKKNDQLKSKLNKLNRFECFQDLHFAYGLLLHDSHQQIINDSMVQNAAFAMFRIAERHLITVRQPSLHRINIMKECRQISEIYGNDHDHLLQAIKLLGQKIETQTRTDLFLQAVNNIIKTIEKSDTFVARSQTWIEFRKLLSPFYQDNSLIATHGKALLEALGQLRFSTLSDTELVAAITTIRQNLEAKKVNQEN